MIFWRFLCVRRVSCKHPNSDESYESDKEESNELGSESGLFGTFRTCLGGLLHDISFAVGVRPAGSDLPFNGGVGSIFLQCGMCTVYCVRTYGKLLCAIDVVVENLLAHAVVKLY